MTKFKDYSQDQISYTFLTPAKLLEETHPARLVSKIVDYLDLEEIYNCYKDVGNDAYHPKMMLKVLFYSYLTGIFSSRKMEDNLIHRADYMYLSGTQVPDFRTLNNFRTRHIAQLPKIFSQIVVLSARLGMLDLKYLAVDGQKIQANANFRGNFNNKRAKNRLENLEKHLKRLLDKDITKDFTQVDKSNKVKQIEKKIEKIEDILKKIEQAQDDIDSEKNKEKVSICMNDNEAKIMKHKDGRSEPSYNHQSIVDSKYGITVATQTKDRLDCSEDLFTILDKANEIINQKPENVLADSGFNDYDAMVKMESRDEIFFSPDTHHEIDKNDSGKTGSFSKNNFKKSENNTYTCPKGKILHFKQYIHKGEDYTVTQYECKNCSECPDKSKCTKSKYRTISIDSRESYRQEMRDKLNSDEGSEIYRKRQWIVEAGHGHDQKNLGFTQHLLKGLSKASLEFLLIRIGSNIGKIIRYKSADMLAMA